MNIIIVLGGPLTVKKTPDIWLKSRLDKLIEIYPILQPNYIIVSGGDPNNIGITEAFVMKEYLVKAKIPKNIILLEISASNTYENATYSYKIIKNRLKENIKIHIITSDFHIQRSKIIFEHIFKNISISMIPSVTPIDTIEYLKLEQNEKHLINKLLNFFNLI
jgi:uncharacterized SAM-binding protein YcdF (DUF218 family)